MKQNTHAHARTHTHTHAHTHTHTQTHTHTHTQTHTHTPVQILEAVLKDKDDPTCMSLIYANNVSFSKGSFCLL